jgi:hypothetical protein
MLKRHNFELVQVVCCEICCHPQQIGALVIFDKLLCSVPFACLK